MNFEDNNLSKIFTEVFDTKRWKHKETHSGKGSTQNLRKQLPFLFNKFNIKSVLDAPCGDFNWLRSVVQHTEIHYTGGDIVSELVKINNEKYQSSNINFIVIDITKDTLPDADLMICRDCLFHLSNNSIFDFFHNFIRSNIPYLLTTTHYNGDFKNLDISDGGFRKIDLFSSPYNLDKNALYKIDDWIEPYPPRGMYCLVKHR